MHDALTGKRVLVTQAAEFTGPALCEVFTAPVAQARANSADLAETGAAEKIVAEAGHVAAGAPGHETVCFMIGPGAGAPDRDPEARPHNRLFGEGFVPAWSNPAHEMRIRFPDSRRRVAPDVAGPA